MVEASLQEETWELKNFYFLEFMYVCMWHILRIFPYSSPISPTDVIFPKTAPAVEKAQEAAQLPWSSGSWIFPGHFSAELK